MRVKGATRTAGGFAWPGGGVGGAEKGRSVVAPFGLHSGLRQRGAHPSRKKPRDEWGTRGPAVLRGRREASRGAARTARGGTTLPPHTFGGKVLF